MTKVYVAIQMTQAEADRVRDDARRAGMSRHAFMRAMLLGADPRPAGGKRPGAGRKRKRKRARGGN